jgi:hypothetical protein
LEWLYETLAGTAGLLKRKSISPILVIAKKFAKAAYAKEKAPITSALSNSYSVGSF